MCSPNAFPQDSKLVIHRLNYFWFFLDFSQEVSLLWSQEEKLPPPKISFLLFFERIIAMSAARKTRRNRRNRPGRCVGSTTPQPATISATNQEPGFKAVTQDYNRKVFTFLLGVAHDPGYKPVELRGIIMESLGVSRIHANYLIIAVRALSRIAHLCKNITMAGTMDIARLAIIGKYLRGLDHKQLSQIQSELRHLCDSPEWITPITMRKLLAQARITVDDEARRKAEDAARRREQSQANKSKPAVMTPMPNGMIKVILRLQPEPAKVFHRQLTLTAQKAHVSAEEYLCAHVADLCAMLVSGGIISRGQEPESSGIANAGDAVRVTKGDGIPAMDSSTAGPPDTAVA